MEQTRDEILTAEEAARRLKISTKTLDRIAANRAGPEKIRLSPRRIGYRESDVAAFIARRPATS